MKITSCDCFSKMEKILKEDGKKLEIEKTTVSRELKLEQKCPYLYVQTGKDNIKKKEYIPALLEYCPFCGKKIEVSE